ncbi:MAG: aminoacyl-tRNA hydrolase [Roseinatronobacter sp.]
MKLFAGLGNPGPKYAGNRHNIGFMALDAIADAHGFSPWRRKFQGELCEGQLEGRKVLLLKPQIFMNLSGDSVMDTMRFYKLTPRDLLVLHDELDLAPGKAKLKSGGGHAGHNGLRSIHAHLGADYGRLRLGIGHPGHKDRVSAYVLSDFAKSEQGWRDDLMRAIAKGAGALAAGDGARFGTILAQEMGSNSPGPDDRSSLRARAEAATATPRAKPAAPDHDTRTTLQKLMDRFK